MRLESAAAAIVWALGTSVAAQEPVGAREPAAVAEPTKDGFGIGRDGSSAVYFAVRRLPERRSIEA